MSPLRLLMTSALLCLTCANVDAQTWAERLGYPADKRVVVMYANYMGSAYEFNRPGQQLLEGGQVRSAGLMVPCPWFEEFAAWCRQHPGHDVGICLTLNSPGDSYRWRPLSGDDTPSLVDADGYFWRSELQVALRAEIDDVAKEIDRQIEHARRAGVKPSHLTPFMGSLITRPDLLELYLDVAERNWIPAVMVEMSPKNVDALRADGFPVTDEFLEIVDRYTLPKLDELHFIPEGESYEDKREKFFALIRSLSPGLSQIIAGPADKTPAIEKLTPRWQLRVWENELLSDKAVQQFLEEEGVLLTDWKEIMFRFETGNAPSISGSPKRSDPPAN